MARRRTSKATEEEAAAKAAEEAADQVDGSENTKTEEEEANEAALREIEKAAEKAKETQEAKPGDNSENDEAGAVSSDAAAAAEPIDVPPPAGACQVWGEHDPHSRACKICPVVTECGEFTAKKKAKAKPSGTRAAGTPRGPRVRTGEVSKFNMADLGSQSGKIDEALETPRTMDELTAYTGFSTSRIKSHIKWLETKRADRCVKVIDGNKISFKLIGEEASAEQSAE